MERTETRSKKVAKWRRNTVTGVTRNLGIWWPKLPNKELVRLKSHSTAPGSIIQNPVFRGRRDLEGFEALVVDYVGSLLDSNLIFLLPLKHVDIAVFWFVDLEIARLQSDS